MEGTRQSATLVKNDANTLPLDAATTAKSVAVIGPNIDLASAVAG